MSTSGPSAGERVRNVRVSRTTLIVELEEGHTISAPLAWFPRLLRASAVQRAHWKIAGGGYGIHWPNLDEDLSVKGLLRGAPAARGSVAKRRAT